MTGTWCFFPEKATRGAFLRVVFSGGELWAEARSCFCEKKKRQECAFELNKTFLSPPIRSTEAFGVLFCGNSSFPLSRHISLTRSLVEPLTPVTEQAQCCVCLQRVIKTKDKLARVFCNFSFMLLRQVGSDILKFWILSTMQTPFTWVRKLTKHQFPAFGTRMTRRIRFSTVLQERKILSLDSDNGLGLLHLHYEKHYFILWFSAFV